MVTIVPLRLIDVRYLAWEPSQAHAARIDSSDVALSKSFMRRPAYCKAERGETYYFTAYLANLYV